MGNSGTPTCSYCGKVGHQENTCWSKNTLCYICGGQNHLARYCLRNRSFGNRGRGRGRGRGGYNQYGNRSESFANTRPSQANDYVMENTNVSNPVNNNSNNNTGVPLQAQPNTQPLQPPSQSF